MYGEVTKDPVCGLNVDESKAKAAGFQSTYKDQTYYFCSEGCQQHFEKNPERYVEKRAEAGRALASRRQERRRGMAKDPVCGIAVDKAQAKAAGLTSEYQGKTYYFCRYRCNQEFDKDPERYLKQEAKPQAIRNRQYRLSPKTRSAASTWTRPRPRPWT